MLVTNSHRGRNKVRPGFASSTTHAHTQMMILVITDSASPAMITVDCTLPAGKKFTYFMLKVTSMHTLYRKVILASNNKLFIGINLRLRCHKSM